MIRSPISAARWVRPEVQPLLESVASSLQEATQAMEEGDTSVLREELSRQSIVMREASFILDVAGLRSGSVVLSLASSAAENCTDEKLVAVVEMVLWAVFHVGNLMESLSYGALDDPAQSLPVVSALSLHLGRAPFENWELFEIPTPSFKEDTLPVSSNRPDFFPLGKELGWVFVALTNAISEFPVIATFIPGFATEFSRLAQHVHLVSSVDDKVSEEIVEKTLRYLRRLLFGVADALRQMDDKTEQGEKIAPFSQWPSELQDVVHAFHLDSALPRSEERHFSEKIQAGLNASVLLATTKAASAYIRELSEGIQKGAVISEENKNVLRAAFEFVGLPVELFNSVLLDQVHQSEKLEHLATSLDGLVLTSLRVKSLPDSVEEVRGSMDEVLVEIGELKSGVQLFVENAPDQESIPQGLAAGHSARFKNIGKLLRDRHLEMMVPYVEKMNDWILRIAGNPTATMEDLKSWALALGEFEYAVEMLRDGSRACASVLLATRKTMVSAGFDPTPGEEMTICTALVKDANITLEFFESEKTPQPLSETTDFPGIGKESPVDIEFAIHEWASDKQQDSPELEDDLNVSVSSSTGGFEYPVEDVEREVSNSEVVFDSETEKTASVLSMSGPAESNFEQLFGDLEKHSSEWKMEALPLPDLDFPGLPSASFDKNTEVSSDFGETRHVPSHIQRLLDSDEGLNDPLSTPVPLPVSSSIEDTILPRQDEVASQDFSFTPEAVVPFDAPASITLDIDMQEVFGEEIGEEIKSLAEWLPELFHVSPDPDILYNIRKSFHTIKGSGRMVGAATLGEMAWSVESVLNRVIEKRLPLSESVVCMVLHANSMVLQFQRALDGLPACWDTKSLVSWANALLKNPDAPPPFPSEVDWTAIALNMEHSNASKNVIGSLEAMEPAVKEPSEEVLVGDISFIEDLSLNHSIVAQEIQQDAMEDHEGVLRLDNNWSEKAKDPEDLDVLWREVAENNASLDASPIVSSDVSSLVPPPSAWNIVEEPLPAVEKAIEPPLVLDEVIHSSGLELVPIDEKGATVEAAPTPVDMSFAKGFGGSVVAERKTEEAVVIDKDQGLTDQSVENSSHVNEEVPAARPLSPPAERSVKTLSLDVILQGTDWKVLLANAQDQAIAARNAIEMSDVTQASACVDRQVLVLDRLAELILMMERNHKMALLRQSVVNKMATTSAGPTSDPSSAETKQPAASVKPPPVNNPPPPTPPRSPVVAVVEEDPPSFWKRWLWGGKSKKSR